MFIGKNDVILLESVGHIFYESVSSFLASMLGKYSTVLRKP